MPIRMSFPLANTAKPVAGPVGVNVPLDFTLTNNVSSDLALEQMQGVLDFVQSIYINNFANTKALSITFNGLQYQINVAAGGWGIYPVLGTAGTLSWTATSVGAGLLVPTIMFNVAVPYFKG